MDFHEAAASWPITPAYEILGPVLDHDADTKRSTVESGRGCETRHSDAKTPKVITHYWYDRYFLPTKDRTFQKAFEPDPCSRCIQPESTKILIQLTWIIAQTLSQLWHNGLKEKYPVGMDREITLPALRTGGLQSSLYGRPKTKINHLRRKRPD